MTPDRWEQIDRLLDEALQKEGGQRAAFLEAACAGDESLRQEVETLLAAHQQAGSFLGLPAPEVAAKAVGQDQAQSLPGSQIGSYQILSLIGKGGMGEVYLARDTRLGRKIGLKLLPSEFSQDQSRVRRLEREARAASTLNHPNIVTIYEVGQFEGTTFVATEYIEGQTLRQQMADRRLKLAELLELAIQTGNALAAAHQAGIVHRDIKPENIMRRPDGLVKVLDFGLAKLTVSEGQSTEISTLTTEQGAVMGTVCYMSPEQALGKEADTRTDLFSLGVVLYEMATGKRPFEGTGSTAIIDAILHQAAASPLQLDPTMPVELERIITKALEKDREERYQSARELVADLRRLQRDIDSERVAAVSSAISTKIQRRTRERLFWAAGLLFLLVLFVIVYFLRPLWTPLPPKIKNLAELTQNTGLTGPLFTDGARLYFAMQTATGQYGLFQLPVSGGTPTPISSPFTRAELLDVAPYGDQLLVVAQESQDQQESPIWILPPLGGAPRRLGEIYGHDAAWSPDGQEIAYLKGNELYLVNSDGTQSHKLVTFPGRLTLPLWPQDHNAPRWAPDGRRLCVSVLDQREDRYDLWEVSKEGENPHAMLPGWHDSRSGSWTIDGRYFLFVSGGALWARREKPGSKPVQLTFPPFKVGRFVPSKDGKKIFISEVRRPRLQVLRYEPASRQKSEFLMGVTAFELTFSWDGNWVAYHDDKVLWRSRADGSEKLQLTFPPLYGEMPRWSPDGRWITFYSSGHKDERDRAYIISAQGGSPQPLIPDQKDQYDAAWFPDGNAMIFGWPYLPNGAEPDPAQRAIYHLDLKTRHVTKLPGSEGLFAPRLSRDGRYVAASLRYGQPDQKLMLFDFKTQKWEELAAVQAHYREWSHDGRYFYFDSSYEKVPGIFRVRISDHQVERVCNLEEFLPSGAFRGAWFGLAPDDSILVARELGTQEIYAFDWEAP